VSYKTVDDDLLLVVRRDAGIRSMKDMAGKRFAMLDGDELSKVYLETLLLGALGPTGPDQLGVITLEPRSSKLTHRLFFGQADVALVYRSGYEAALELNPQIGQRLQVLDAYTFKTRSPFIGLFGAHVDDAFREVLIQIILTVGDTPRGRQMLQLYQGNVMARASVSEIAPYKALLDKRRLLKLTGSARTVKP
jgi:ABC-type phosphate/phosphonate transport system substrate-binding protein